MEEEDRRELRADFQHLRRWRKSVEQAQSYTFKAVITVIAGQNGWCCVVSDTTKNLFSANNFIRAGYRLYEPRHPWGGPIHCIGKSPPSLSHSLNGNQALRRACSRAKVAQARKLARVKSPGGHVAAGLFLLSSAV
jgi:hypothetical protein